MGWLKIEKLEYLENGTEIFYKIKKFLICASDYTFWEVTFKFCSSIPRNRKRVEKLSLLGKKYGKRFPAHSLLNFDKILFFLKLKLWFDNSLFSFHVNQDNFVNFTLLCIFKRNWISLGRYINHQLQYALINCINWYLYQVFRLLL